MIGKVPGKVQPLHWTGSGVLSPVDRITEVFCGLLMVLASTLLVGQDGTGGPEKVHTLLRAGLGGNLAWGIIDGVLYLMTQRFERGRQARLVAAVREADGDVESRAALGEAIAPALVASMTNAEAAHLFGALRAMAGRTGPVRAHLTRGDFVGALACFCLCVGCALPAVVPFALLETPAVALRVSNGVSLASLFALGVLWAKVIGARPLASGLGLLLLGAALVALQIAFGG
jgi:hypothetical protein